MNDWSQVFSRALQQNFTPDEIHPIYQVEMEARSFFDWGGIVPPFLSLQNIQKDPPHIRYYWTSRDRDAVCPFCGTTSPKRCYDPFEKPVQDVPQDGHTVYPLVRCQKYFDLCNLISYRAKVHQNKPKQPTSATTVDPHTKRSGPDCDSAW